MVGVTLSLAVRSLAAHGSRSLLAALGFAVGIASVIVVVSIGQGSAEKIRREMVGLGADLLVLQRGQSMHGGKGARISAPPFDRADVEAIAEQVLGIRHLAPVASQPMLAIAGGTSWTASVVGTSDDYFRVYRWRLAAGRTFTDYEQEIGKSVCILGATVHARLFNAQPAIGEVLRLRSMPCEVIGVLEKRGSADELVGDGIIVMPLLAFHRRLLGKNDVHRIVMSRQPGVASKRVMDGVDGLMRERRLVSAGPQSDFIIGDMTMAATAAAGTSRAMLALLGALGIVSLLAGGIGVMNVLLVSVSERTREIGILLAVGATPQQIRTQFLAEAGLLSLAGGVMGILSGLLAAAVAVTWLELPLVVDPVTLLMAIMVASLAGLLSGYGPAARASRLDPIEALRQG